MKMYDFRPLEVIESFQNFGIDNIDDMSLEELKTEYKSALKEKENMTRELESVKNTKVAQSPTYIIKERIENSDKYIEKIEKKLNAQISDEELKRLKDYVKESNNEKEEIKRLKDSVKESNNEKEEDDY